MRQIVDVDPDEKTKIFRLQGLNKRTYLLVNQVLQFMKTHKLPVEILTSKVANAQFAKDFFRIIDWQDDGGVSLEDLAQPLIALGLATDINFVQKTLKVLNPEKFGSGQFDNELSMKEFSNIFKSDSVSEKLIKLILDRLAEATKEGPMLKDTTMMGETEQSEMSAEDRLLGASINKPSWKV